MGALYAVEVSAAKLESVDKKTWTQRDSLAVFTASAFFLSKREQTCDKLFQLCNTNILIHFIRIESTVILIIQSNMNCHDAPTIQFNY